MQVAADVAKAVVEEHPIVAKVGLLSVGFDNLKKSAVRKDDLDDMEKRLRSEFEGRWEGQRNRAKKDKEILKDAVVRIDILESDAPAKLVLEHKLQESIVKLGRSTDKKFASVYNYVDAVATEGRQRDEVSNNRIGALEHSNHAFQNDLARLYATESEPSSALQNDGPVLANELSSWMLDPELHSEDEQCNQPSLLAELLDQDDEKSVGCDTSTTANGRATLMFDPDLHSEDEQCNQPSSLAELLEEDDEKSVGCDTSTTANGRATLMFDPDLHSEDEQCNQPSSLAELLEEDDEKSVGCDTSTAANGRATLAPSHSEDTSDIESDGEQHSEGHFAISKAESAETCVPCVHSDEASEEDTQDTSPTELFQSGTQNLSPIHDAETTIVNGIHSHTGHSDSDVERTLPGSYILTQLASPEMVKDPQYLHALSKLASDYIVATLRRAADKSIIFCRSALFIAFAMAGIAFVTGIGVALWVEVILIVTEPNGIYNQIEHF
ncbi:hypothetical protein BDZ89DRAFT_1139243 [Hymenopellis radicata]|nr:hypothetical protein BDZ89DRAFT_1139243 [Hymenopellis radicata]